MSKIAWYKEVLELEPGSKVFFPLAKLCMESEDYSEALSTLRMGLERHPEHVEARLLLVEVLDKLGEREAVREQVHALAGKMSSYPSFWRAWAKVLFERKDTQDSALALNFLAAYFQGSPVSWTDVIHRGLGALLEDAESEENMQELPTRAIREAFSRVDAEHGADANETDAEPDTEPVAMDDGAEEPLTLRTRSMAEVLAEQGDYEGAVDIYKELLFAAKSATSRKDIEKRMNELMQLQSGAAQAPSKKENGASLGVGVTSQTKLISMLENLAQRLEARTA